MSRIFSALSVLALLAGCAKQADIKSGVNLEELLKGKGRATPDRQEAIPNTYFELTAWTGVTEKLHRQSPQRRALLQSVR